MKRIISLVIVCSASALGATESPLFFIGAKGGYQWASDRNYNDSKPNSAILGVFAGVQLSQEWSWDVGYQNHEELKADVTSVNVNTWLIESALRYDWYLQDRLSLYGRFGAAYWDMDKIQLSSDKLNATGFSPLGEVGVSYNLAPNTRLSAGYQYIDSIGKSNTGRYDSHGLLVGLTYKFGGSTNTTSIKVNSSSTNEDILAKDTVTVKSLPQAQFFSPKTVVALFGFDSIESSNEVIEQLAEVASVLNTHSQAQATVVGHSDSTGLPSYNQKLSERRAQVVTNKLIELDVAPRQLEWKGVGESHPIADNTTVEGRAQNRRVEIIIPSFQFLE